MLIQVIKCVLFTDTFSEHKALPPSLTTDQRKGSSGCSVLSDIITERSSSLSNRTQEHKQTGVMSLTEDQDKDTVQMLRIGFTAKLPLSPLLFLIYHYFFVVCFCRNGCILVSPLVIVMNHLLPPGAICHLYWGMTG